MSMKIISVVPVAKGIGKECLTYFSAKDIAVGNIVAVPVRKKIVDALVLSCDDLSSAKSIVKTSDFKLKKIEEYHSRR